MHHILCLLSPLKYIFVTPYVIIIPQRDPLHTLATTQAATTQVVAATPVATTPATATPWLPVQPVKWNPLPSACLSTDLTPDQQRADSSPAQQEERHQTNYPGAHAHSMPLLLSDRTHVIIVKEEFGDM